MERIKINIVALECAKNIFHIITGHLASVAVLATLIWTPLSPAQQVPDTVAPGRVEEQFKRLKIPAPAPDSVVPGQRDILAPDGADAIQFQLSSLRVEGNTVIKDAELEPVFQAFLKTEITLADLYTIANKITAFYRNQGYVLSQAIVPAQEIAKDGSATIRLIEGFISKIDIIGVEETEKTILARYLNKIQASRPLTAHDLERYLLLANDLSGTSVSATLAPSAGIQGAAELSSQVTHERIEAFAGIGNRGSEFQGPYQVAGQVGFNNLFGRFDSTSLFVVSTGDEELNLVSLSHSQPIGSEGFNIAASVSGTNTEVGGSLSALEIKTDTVTANLTGTYPFIRSRLKNLSGHTIFSVHNSESERLASVEGSQILDTEDRVRALRAGLSYDKVDKHRGVNLIEVEVSQGLDIFNATETGSPGLSRENGESDFTKISLYGARVQSLRNNWSILAAVDAQYAFDDLLSSEQFGVGGANIGRGHDASEIVGDSGIAGKLELRYSRQSSASWLDNYVAYAFIDGGEIERKSPSAGQDDRESIASLGIGLRFKIRENLSGYLEIADPISHDVSSEENQDPRVFFSIAIQK